MSKLENRETRETILGRFLLLGLKENECKTFTKEEIRQVLESNDFKTDNIRFNQIMTRTFGGAIAGDTEKGFKLNTEDDWHWNELLESVNDMRRGMELPLLKESDFQISLGQIDRKG